MKSLCGTRHKAVDWMIFRKRTRRMFYRLLIVMGVGFFLQKLVFPWLVADSCKDSYKKSQQVEVYTVLIRQSAQPNLQFT
jgi:cell division protein FtsB